jgi:hypothetical protein
MPIPPTLHRVLVGGYDPGSTSHYWWERFASLHPTWQFKTWSDPVNPSDWETGHLFGSCRSGAQVADLLRLEILWREGGVYVDSDIEPLSSLDHLLDSGFFIGTEDGKSLSSGVIGASAGHAAVRALLDRVLEYDELPITAPENETTGPKMISRVLEARDDIFVLPREVFYPYNPRLPFAATPDIRSRHAVLVHHWEASWLPSQAPADRTRLGERVIGWCRAQARERGLPLLQRVLLEVGGPRAVNSASLGDGTVLVATTDGFPILLPSGDLSITPEVVAYGWYDPALLAFVDRVGLPRDEVTSELACPTGRPERMTPCPSPIRTSSATMS